MEIIVNESRKPKAVVGDIIKVSGTHFFIVGKLEPDGGGGYNSRKYVTAINLTMKCTTAHKFETVDELVLALAKDFDYKVIKSENAILSINE